MDATYTVQRSATINAPRQAIFDRIVHFKRWPEWSPWEELDPDMTKTYTGTDGEVGSHYAWNGNRRAGAGSMTVTSLDKPHSMTSDLNFTRPFKSDSMMGLTLTPEGQSTRVDWTMTSHPIFMIRRREFKYIHCDSDPPLLFNVDKDPQERTNLADDPTYADTASSFAAEVAARWDSAAIRRRVIQSQRARRTLHAAMSQGPLNSWDHAPVTDVANMYVRNHMDWAEAGGRSRL